MENTHIRTSVFTIPLIRIIMYIALVLLLIRKNFLPAGLIIFILLLTGLTLLWSRFALRGLEMAAAISPKRVFPGESAKLKISFHNQKRLPLNLEWQQRLLPDILWEKEQQGKLEQIISGQKLVGGHQRISHTYELKALRRGYFCLKPLLIEAQDGLGMYRNTAELENKALIVYPQIRDIADLELKPADLIGDRRDQRPLMPDLIRIAGLRDYTPDIPARFINWKASAHKDDLLAKILEPSADLRICIGVDVTSFTRPQELEEEFEEALSVAASIAYWAENNSIPVALIANGQQKGLDAPAVIPMSGAPNHIVFILEALARLEMKPWGPLDEMIRMEQNNLPWGTTLVWIASHQAPIGSSPLSNTLYYGVGRGIIHEK